MIRAKFFAKALANWPPKVLCIGLAIILFIFHRLSNLEQRFLSVPLSIERTGALMPSSSYLRMIRVSLRGEANSIYPIMDGDIEVYVDMGDYSDPGTYTVPVQWRKKGSALGVEPLQITVDPIEITLSLDRKISKFVPLSANLRGQVESGYTMTSYSLNPTQIIIDGPAELMSGIYGLYTEPIDLDGRTSDFSVAVNILNRDPLIVIRGNGITEFNGNISQIIPVRNILNVPIVLTNLMEGLKGELFFKTANIHLEGANQQSLNEFEVPEDFLTVDCSEINGSGAYTLKIHTGIFANIIFRIDPEEVELLVYPEGVELP